MINDFGSLFWSHASLHRLAHAYTQSRIRGEATLYTEPTIFAIATTSRSVPFWPSFAFLTWTLTSLTLLLTYTRIIFKISSYFFLVVCLLVWLTYYYFICLCLFMFKYTYTVHGYTQRIWTAVFLLLFFFF